MSHSVYHCMCELQNSLRILHLIKVSYMLDIPATEDYFTCATESTKVTEGVIVTGSSELVHKSYTGYTF